MVHCFSRCASGRRSPNRVVTVAVTFFAVCFLLASLLLGHPARANNGGLSVIVSEVLVEGGLDELANATDALTAPFRGRRSTVGELQILAQLLESLYHEAGFFLARVTIPPQEVNDGDPFHLIVLDGHFESVNLQGVPVQSRARLQSMLNPMVNRSFLTMAEFERILTLARQTPGLTLRTTLVPGEGVGASELVVEGEQTRFGGSIALNGQLRGGPSPWGASLQARFNQPFGRGEQFTVHASGTTDSIFAAPDNRTVGVNVRWPVGVSGTDLRLGLTDSPSYRPSPHFLIPATSTQSQRISVELGKPLRLSQSEELRLFAAVDGTNQSMEAPDFQVTLYEDRVRVLRLGANSRRDMSTGTRVSWSVQWSHGLAFASRRVEDVLQTGIPFSRPGAEPAFQKVNGTASWRWPFMAGYALTSTLRAQYALFGPLPSTELFSPTGGNGLPSLALAVGSGDHGWSVREELDTRFSLFHDKLQLTVYAFVAAGGASDYGPGVSAFASAVGSGLRGDMGPFSWSLEYARGHDEFFSDRRTVVGLEVSF